jgi:two-component system sensor histidine kinase HydH
MASEWLLQSAMRGMAKLRMSENQRSRRVLNGALLAIVLVLASALVIVPTLSLRAVERTARELSRAQGETFVRAAVDGWRRLEDDPDEAELEAFLKTHRNAGLRYVGIARGPGAAMVVEAGASRGTGPTSGEVGQMVDSGGLKRLTLPIPPLRRPRPGARPGPPDRPRAHLGPPHPFDGDGVLGGRGPRGGPDGPQHIIVAFEPLTANQLIQDASRARDVGVLAAFVLAILGLAIRHILEQRAGLQERLARERHLAALGEMASVMAHEIRNPLASLKGHAQLLSESLPEGEKTHKRSERVVKEAIRLEALTNDLLDFAKTGQPNRERIDPASLVQEAADAVSLGGIRIDSAAAPDRWPLDPLRMRQVLENVLRNAVQATPDGAQPPQATISVGRSGLVIEVADTGAGIAAADLAAIFEPFHTQRTRGTGLGLAVSRRIVEQHGGTISAANRTGGGAVFRMEIPA